MPPLSFGRINATVLGVLGVFAFVYTTSVVCVVSAPSTHAVAQCNA